MESRDRKDKDGNSHEGQTGDLRGYRGTALHVFGVVVRLAKLRLPELYVEAGSDRGLHESTVTELFPAHLFGGADFISW